MILIRRVITLAGISLLLGNMLGCVTAQFGTPIASFRDSISRSGAVVANYLTEMNAFEREIYIDSVFYDPDAKVLAVDSAGKSTPLMGTIFSGPSIKARLDAINLIGAYASRLAELAGSQAPQQFSTNVNALGQSLTNLGQTFQTIATQHQNNPQQTKDSTALSYVGPVSTLVGTLGQMYLTQQRDQAVKIAVDQGAPKVRQILKLLEADMSQVVEPLELTGLYEELSNRVLAYNQRVDKTHDPNHPTPFTQSEREAALTEINSSLSRLDAAAASNPATLVQSMSDAHEALVKYADSSKLPTDFTSLVSALQAFENNVTSVATAVQAIVDLRKGTIK